MSNEGAEIRYTKYILEFSMDIDGNVERSDIIGAIFGQTEGLFGPTFDLREMAKTGKIGRIEVEIKSRDRRTMGVIKVPSSLDIVGTSLIAAMIETVDQVGPFRSTIKLKSIKDFREEKIKAIVKRAKKILESWKIEKIPAVEDVFKELETHMVPRQVKEINGITIGPQALSSSEIILVEGRADVLNLVKYGIENVASIGGGKIPDRVKEVLKNKKKVIAFLDGDRSGYLNLKKLANIVKRIDYVAFAPEGKEVEDLKPDEIFEALRNLRPFNEAAKVKKPELKPYMNFVNQIMGTLEALLLKNNEVVKKVSVSELIETLQSMKKDEIDTIVMDGIITQRLVDLSEEKGISTIIGNRIRQLSRVPENLLLYPIKSGE